MTMIEVQLAPRATVSEELRQSVANALDQERVSVDAWIGLSGERTQEDTAHPIAPPSLSLLLTTGGPLGSDETLRAILPRVARVLARVRDSVPVLPVGVEFIVGDERFRFAFLPDETPDGIERGMAQILDVDTRSGGAFGWLNDEGQWSVL